MTKFSYFVAGAILFAMSGLSAARHGESPVATAGHQTQRQYLSGHDKDDAVPWQFMCTSGQRAGEWTTLPVPSQWDVLGFGTLNYRKDRGPAADEKGLYKHEFTVPAGWAGKRVYLVFEGVMTDTTATVNGQSVGPTHQGGFYRFKYDVTPLLKFDAPNLLEVTVAKHSANDSVNNAERTADYWLFGGIYRPVYLQAVPQQFIDRVAINARADGQFDMDVFTDGAADGDMIEAQITQLDGRPVGEPFKAKIAGNTATLSARIDSPRQWSAETPNLYRVAVRLERGGQVVHSYDQRFGFRTIEVRDGDGIYVNGRRVVLKGVNRHSSWPDSGRCLSEKVHRLDVETMKDMNMNAVRMSHYPPDAEFLDVCDELGLYVLDELAGWHQYYDTPTGKRLVEATVTRDVNHPCILFWDNGNEGGFNKDLDEVFGQFDPQQRRVLHPWEEFNGINTAHYLEYDRAAVASQGAPTRHGTGKTYEEWEDTKDPHKYIYMPAEMLHGLYDGGAGAGLEDYWRLMSDSPVLGGGFFWVFADEGIKRADTGKMDCSGNEAPDGIVGPYREREGSFYTIKELWSPIQVTRNADGTLTVENRYSFTDANECKFTWRLRRFKRPNEPGAGYTLVNTSGPNTFNVPSIPPGETAKVRIGLPSTDEVADALAIRVDDPSGRELWTWVWPISEPPAEPGADNGNRNISPRLRRGTGQGEGALESRNAVITETADDLVVTTGDLEVRFSRETGLLSGVRRGEQTFSLVHGPWPAVDGSKEHPIDAIFTLKSLKHHLDGRDAVITATYDGELQEAVWRVRPDGWVQCDYRYQATGPMQYHGVQFDYPEHLVKGKRWLGDGPFRVWKNRLRGNTLGVWENDYNNTITGYSGWEYPEFKGCFANVRWLQLRTIEGPITIVPGSQDVFVQVLTPDEPPDNLVGETKVSLPEAGLAILNAIPPKGSKFKPAASTGPQGQLNQAAGDYAGSVSFCFGELP
jgi:hypothetical protein